MRKLVCLLLVVIYISLSTADYDPWGNQPTGMGATIGEDVFMPLPQAATYRRTVKNAKGKEIEHLYRVCNGKNKNVCGFWENTSTKKKVASGATTYNKNKQSLVIKKVRKSDAALYMTGNKKQTFELFLYSN